MTNQPGVNHFHIQLMWMYWASEQNRTFGHWTWNQKSFRKHHKPNQLINRNNIKLISKQVPKCLFISILNFTQNCSITRYTKIKITQEQSFVNTYWLAYARKLITVDSRQCVYQIESIEELEETEVFRCESNNKLNKQTFIHFVLFCFASASVRFGFFSSRDNSMKDTSGSWIAKEAETKTSIEICAIQPFTIFHGIAVFAWCQIHLFDIFWSLDGTNRNEGNIISVSFV